MTYMQNLKDMRSRAADLACGHAEYLLWNDNLSEDEHEAVVRAMDFHANMRDKLDQQISWYNRDTGWVYPSLPAWTD